MVTLYLCLGGKNQRYDLVVDTGSELIRAQCKTGRLRDGVIIFNLYSHSRNGTKDYKGQVDWFLVYCPDTDCVYKVLESEVGISQFSLRTEPSKANTTLINWAIDYKL